MVLKLKSKINADNVNLVLISLKVINKKNHMYNKLVTIYILRNLLINLMIRMKRKNIKPLNVMVSNYVIIA